MGHGFNNVVELPQGTPCKECITPYRKNTKPRKWPQCTSIMRYFLVKQHGDVAAALPPNFRGFVRRKLKQTWDSKNYSLWSGKGKKTIEFLRIYQTRGIILNCSSFSVVRLGFPKWTLRANRIVQPLQSRHNKNFGTWVSWINHSWCSPSPAQEGSLLIQSRHSVWLLPQKRAMFDFFCTPLR